MEIVEASLLYENWGPSDGESYQWELTDTEGSVIQGSLQISGVPGTQAFDYADYPF
jgi:hypothetical protein